MGSQSRSFCNYTPHQEARLARARGQLALRPEAARLKAALERQTRKSDELLAQMEEYGWMLSPEQLKARAALRR